MIGDKCDQCDADTAGKMPQCEVCGGCYYQWKVTLDSLSRNISVEISGAYNISLTPNQPGIVSILLQSSIILRLTHTETN